MSWLLCFPLSSNFRKTPEERKKNILHNQLSFSQNRQNWLFIKRNTAFKYFKNYNKLKKGILNLSYFKQLHMRIQSLNLMNKNFVCKHYKIHKVPITVYIMIQTLKNDSIRCVNSQRLFRVEII